MTAHSVGTAGTAVESGPETSNSRPSYEFINCEELASRWSVPESWIREHVRTRCKDPIPHIRFTKYVRFRWGSPELEEWAEQRIVSSSNRVAGRALGKESK
jgi:predicted DNA-binding transcriptional regulator AlpA